MSEWLTTGQMIDKLKVGEIAEDDIGGFKKDHFYIKRNVDGLVIYRNEAELKEQNGESLILNNFLLRREWRIVPNYVSFGEAMEALANGKKVKMYYGPHDKPLKSFNKQTVISTADGTGLSFGDWINSKWSIEDYGEETK